MTLSESTRQSIVIYKTNKTNKNISQKNHMNIVFTFSYLFVCPPSWGSVAPELHPVTSGLIVSIPALLVSVRGWRCCSITTVATT